MRLKLVSLLLLISLWPTATYYQRTPMQNRVDAILSDTGAFGVRNLQVEFQGTLEYPGGQKTPFKLFVLKGDSRWETGAGEAKRSLVRRGQRVQEKSGGRTKYDRTSTFANSTVNLLPALALHNISENPLFEQRLVTDRQGFTGLEFKKAGGFDSRNAFRACRVTFWLDESDRILETVYEDLNGGTGELAYRYGYSRKLGGSVDQPSEVEVSRSGRLEYTARVSSVATRSGDTTLFAFDSERSVR